MKSRIALLLVPLALLGACKGDDLRFPKGTVERRGQTLFAEKGLVEDFPLSEVPVLEAEIRQSSRVGEKNWNAAFTVDGKVEDIAKAVRDRMLEAGYNEDSEATSTAGIIRLFTNAKYQVHTLVSTGPDDNVLVTYTVTEL